MFDTQKELPKLHWSKVSLGQKKIKSPLEYILKRSSNNNKKGGFKMFSGEDGSV